MSDDFIFKEETEELKQENCSARMSHLDFLLKTQQHNFPMLNMPSNV